MLAEDNQLIPIDKTIEDQLLNNGFAYYSDWEFGPVSGWQTSHNHHVFNLMRHDHGYWVILGSHSGGENERLNIGSLNNAADIINLRDALKKLW